MINGDILKAKFLHVLPTCIISVIHNHAKIFQNIVMRGVLPIMKYPNPNEKVPIPGVNITYIKPAITRPNIIVGDFTYFADKDFEAHVAHHYDFIGGE